MFSVLGAHNSWYHSCPITTRKIGSQERKKKAMMHREKVYFCNLVGFKGKVNTLVGIKGKVRSLVPSLLIKLSQVLSLWM